MVPEELLCCRFLINTQKGSVISFHRFPTDKERGSEWIAAVKRKDWKPNEHTWLCCANFVSGKKSNDPLSLIMCPVYSALLVVL